MNELAAIRNEDVRLDNPVALYRDGDHEIYWIGSLEETVFHCNSYLLRSGDRAYLIDPGGHGHFPQVRERVGKIMSPQDVTHIIVHHQDPDLCASLPLWLGIQPDITVLTHSRAAVLLPHYGISSDRIQSIDQSEMQLSDGGTLQFVPAPFLHFPGAFATYDTRSGFLFSGDIFAALSGVWKLMVEDMEEHLGFMELFHVDYMASNKAAKGFLNNLGDREIHGILPQHGSIIPASHVGEAFDWLGNLPCGLDLIYPD